jgi:hypothetical protein
MFIPFSFQAEALLSSRPDAAIWLADVFSSRFWTTAVPNRLVAPITKIMVALLSLVLLVFCFHVFTAIAISIC